MPALNPISALRHRGSPRGEPYVWLTAMGLAVGIIMVIGLLSVIIVNGVSVFWPQPIARLTIAEPGKPVVVTMAQVVEERPMRALPSAAATAAAPAEQLLFRANKEFGQAPFFFVAVTTIIGHEQPTSAMIVERYKNGTLIGVPLTVTASGQAPLAADSPQFTNVFTAGIAGAKVLVDEASELRVSRIGGLDRQQKRLEKRRDQLLSAEQKKPHRGDAQLSSAATSSALADLNTKIAALQSEIEATTAAAAQIEKRAATATLNLRLGDDRPGSGKEVTIPLASIVAWHQPNQLGLFGKLGVFCARAWAFVAHEPREVNTEGGIYPAIIGTFIMTVLMSAAVVPFGVIAALYLREYAKQGMAVRVVRICVNNLAGVPSIVFGVFGLGFFVYITGSGVDWLFFSDHSSAVFKTGGIMWASLTLALMTVPVVIVATEEALAAVPRGAREGSLACGASKWQTIQHIVLPASLSGIITGLILAMARGAGEVAPLMMVGVVKSADVPISGDWLDTDLIPGIHLNQKFMHLGFHIYDLGFQSPDSDAVKPLVFATTLVLILLVLVLNLGAIILRERLRRRYQGATF